MSGTVWPSLWQRSISLGILVLRGMEHGSCKALAKLSSARSLSYLTQCTEVSWCIEAPYQITTSISPPLLILLSPVSLSAGLRGEGYVRGIAGVRVERVQSTLCEISQQGTLLQTLQGENLLNNTLKLLSPSLFPSLSSLPPPPPSFPLSRMPLISSCSHAGLLSSAARRNTMSTILHNTSPMPAIA